MATLHLTAEQLANLFMQLQHLESAGLACDQALSILCRSEKRLRKPLLLMKQQIKAGCTVSEAGFNAGLFNENHQKLLEAAEISGQLVKVYGQLAEYYRQRASRIKKIKSRLTLSVAVLTLALFIQPIPDLVNSTITVFQYLQLSVGRLFIIGLTVWCLLKLPKVFRLLRIESLWHGLQLHIPLVKNWVIKRQINQFFFMLSIMLDSGVVFSEALTKSVASIKNTSIQKEFNPALALIHSGASAVEILADVSVIDRTMLQIMTSSEQSGQLANSIWHFAMIESENLSLQDDAQAEWLVRIVYSAIAAWMAYSILTNSLIT